MYTNSVLLIYQGERSACALGTLTPTVASGERALEVSTQYPRGSACAFEETTSSISSSVHYEFAINKL